MAQQQFEDLNSGFIQELFEQYLRAPESVDPKWRALFEHTPEKLESSPVVQRVRELYPGTANGGNGAPAAAEAAAPPQQLLGAVAAAMALVKAHRMHGHLLRASIRSAATRPATRRSSPSASSRGSRPSSRPRCPHASCGSTSPARRWPRPSRSSVRPTAGRWRTRSSTSRGHEERVWLGRRSSRAGTAGLSPGRAAMLLRRLTEVEGMERYLRRAFLGQKQFSIEGPRRDGADAGRGDRARREGRRSRRRHRHGAPRPAERPRAHRRAALRRDPPRVRGRAAARGVGPIPRAAPGREVPPRREGVRHTEDGE